MQLTLDSDLQRVANLSLEKNILGNTDAKDCTRGAAVVLDVDTFGVLASSSYPTYDVNQLVESIAGDGKYYNQLINDEDEPMVNLALNGVFTPGSVFKPVVALAALQEGSSARRPLSTARDTTSWPTCVWAVPAEAGTPGMCMGRWPIPATRFFLRWDMI